MAPRQPIIPPFLKDYYEGSNSEGKARIELIAVEYEMKRQDFMQNTYPAQAIFQNDWNKLMGQRKQLDPEQLVWHIREDHRKQAENVAKASGYQEKRQEQQQSQQPSEAKPGQQKPTNTAKPQREIKPEVSQSRSKASEVPQNAQAKTEQSKEAAKTPDNRREAFQKSLKELRQQQSVRSMQREGSRMTQRPR